MRALKEHDLEHRNLVQDGSSSIGIQIKESEVKGA
jgi:hypothetical protein